MSEYPVLVLDDDAAILVAIQESLKANHYTYFGTSKASEALSELEKTQFAVAISDQRMADMPGLQFLKTLKTQQPLCSCILTTGVLTSEIFLEAINEVNVFRCLRKPWSLEDLMTSIEDAYRHFERQIAFEKAHEAILEINQQLAEENTRLRQQLKHT